MISHVTVTNYHTSIISHMNVVTSHSHMITHYKEHYRKFQNNNCYDSMLKVLSKELTLVLSDTRELDRVPNTK